MKINKKNKQNKLVKNFNKFPVKKKIFKKQKIIDNVNIQDNLRKTKTNENI